MISVLYHHESLLTKDRYFTANSGSKAVVLPKAGHPPQTQEPGLQFYWVWIGEVDSRCFKHSTLSLASEQTSKSLKSSRAPIVEVKRVNLANWTLWISPKFITGVKSALYKCRENITKLIIGFWELINSLLITIYDFLQVSWQDLLSLLWW